MRVISGKYKGLNLNGFDINGTRPTMDRIKESVFGIIQNNIKDSTVLDLFAGSGSMGIEALSNGAKNCYFADNNIKLINILKKNLNGINEKFTIINNDYKDSLLSFNSSNIKFDIIFLDPPYKLNLINDCLKKIYEYDLLNKNGIIICEYELESISFDAYSIIKEKKYGSKNIRIYKNLL